MPYTTLPLIVFTQRNFVADFLQGKCDFRGKTAVLRFWAFGGLRFNVRWSSEVHWKARCGLPISVNWTFFARCYGWGATSDYPFKIGDFAPTGGGGGWPKIFGRRGRLHHCHQPLYSLNDLSYDIKIWTDFSSVLPQSTRLTDGRTDRQTDRLNSHR